MINKINFKGCEAIVFGKGPSFCNPLKKDNQIHVCVNDTTNVINDPDIMVFNDEESINKINIEKLKQLKLIVLPYYPHVGRTARPDINVSWENIKSNFKDLSCEWFPYNLKTSLPVKGYPNFQSALTSSNTAIEFLILMGVKNITTYGIGTEDGYSDSFKRTSGSYNVSMIGQEIRRRCEVNNVRLKMK